MPKGAQELLSFRLRWFASVTVSVFTSMSLRADMYRQNAAEARQRARQTSDPCIKTAFEEVARGWLLLAEQVEWMGSRKPQTEK
jgi:hypothetical protein